MAYFFINPFGVDGDRLTVPTDTQVDGSVSYQQGFGIDYEKNLLSDPDAKPMPRDQTNQIFFDITTNIQQYQTQGVPLFITTTDNGGVAYPYDIYARVRYDDGVNGFQLYESLIDANTNLPSDALTWRIISNNLGGVPTGAIIDFGIPVAPAGYLLCDGSALARATWPTLFSAITFAQNGTTTNSAATITGLTDTSIMFEGMMIEGTGIPANTTILSIDSATAITMDQDATASATVSVRFFPWGNGNGTTSFNVPDLRRRTRVGSGGSASTDPLGIGNITGQIGGEESHTQTEPEMVAHTHSTTTSLHAADTTVTASTLIGHAQNTDPSTNVGGVVIGSTGGGDAFNIIQPSAIVTACIKT